VEFEHVKEEDEKVWLYENYEKFMTSKDSSDVSDKEKIKAL
jgi:2-oxoglutarate dehydrogenase complex dehydrogenase (E1) component-like enzyme